MLGAVAASLQVPALLRLSRLSFLFLRLLPQGVGHVLRAAFLRPSLFWRLHRRLLCDISLCDGPLCFLCDDAILCDLSSPPLCDSRLFDILLCDTLDQRVSPAFPLLRVFVTDSYSARCLGYGHAASFWALSHGCFPLLYCFAFPYHACALLLWGGCFFPCLR